ncbi:MAG: cobalamin biosynthesis protein [Chloroflexota bacterium]
MAELLVLPLALALDLAWGEPPRPVHPVVGMGKVIAWLERGSRPARSPRARLAYGVGMALLAVTLFTIPVYLLLSYLRVLSPVAYVLVAALLFKTTFSLKELRRAARRVRDSLEDGQLARARLELRALVSRDTEGLSEPLAVSAAVESVAENAADSLVAPLFYYLFFGVAGAVAYRVVNTLDAMVGYHGGYEHLGKFAARLDDVLNYLPARLAGLLLVGAVGVTGGPAARSWRTMRAGHARTESPNAGWPMAAMAGGLVVTLHKVGHYRLGEGRLPVPRDIGAALRLVLVAALTWALVVMIAEVVGYALAA